MPVIFVLYLEDSDPARALKLIRRLGDPLSKSIPHVTVYGPVRNREAPPPLRQVVVDRIFLEGLGRWKSPKRQTIFIRCHLDEQQFFHYKPDFPSSVPHITLYDGEDSRWADLLYETLLPFSFMGSISFRKGRSLTEKQLGKKGTRGLPPAVIDDGLLYRALFGDSEGTNRVKDLSPDERLEKIRCLAGRLLEDLGSRSPKQPSCGSILSARNDTSRLQLDFGFQFEAVHKPQSYKSTSLARKALGQFLTPPELAISIIKATRAFLTKGQPVFFGDPAVGSGVFFGAVRSVLDDYDLIESIGIDIDPNICEVCDNVWGRKGLSVVNKDFFSVSLEPTRNLIVCNPPYVRFQEIPLARRQELKALIDRYLAIDLRNTCSLYVYFVLYSFLWMKEMGVAAWLISSEVTSADYALPLRQFLAEKVTILRIHNYEPSELQFDNVFTSSTLIIFRNQKPQSNHCVDYTYSGSLDSPRERLSLEQNTLSRSNRWYLAPTGFRLRQKGVNDFSFGDLFSVKRGIATGANNFFIIAPETVDKFDIPRRFLKAILPNPRSLKTDVISEGSFGGAGLPELYLIDCELPEGVVLDRFPLFWDYLAQGKKQNIHTRCLPSRRKPWYRQEQRSPATFYCTYIGRKRENHSPFRFIWNQTGVLATNLYLFVEPKGRLQEAIDAGYISIQLVFEALKEIEIGALTEHSRIYGGGLFKNEPSDLKKVILKNFKRLIL